MVENGMKQTLHRIKNSYRIVAEERAAVVADHTAADRIVAAGRTLTNTYIQNRCELIRP